MIQIGNQHFWLWNRIEQLYASVLKIHISKERNMFVSENFIRSLVSRCGKHTVYTVGGTLYSQICNFLQLKHRLHSPEKSRIERVIQYLTE